MNLHHGDCIEVMATLPEASVDAIVTDPPYGLEFMGKAWDHGAIGRPFADAMYRIAKPSAYLLAFGGTRTVHRMTCALEDAGWIIRDMLVWGYASGFPKSKASLKPAWEPIVMARKPGPLRPLAIDECRIGWGADKPTQEEWNRAGSSGSAGANGYAGQFSAGMKQAYADGKMPVPPGRWPANIVLTDPIFDGPTHVFLPWSTPTECSIPWCKEPPEAHSQPGAARVVVGGGEAGGGFGIRGRGALGVMNDDGWRPSDEGGVVGYGDTGTYSRFFLVPKAARSDREPVLGASPAAPSREDLRVESAHSTVCAKCGRQRVNVPGAACQCADPEWVRKPQTARVNGHPTVKPIDLMRHLVRLVTPTGGVVLDPFLGSGTTAIAADLEGFEWIGIEKEAEYVDIAKARLNGTQKGLAL